MEALEYSKPISRHLFVEHPEISEADFEKEMMLRVRKLGELKVSLQRELPKIFPNIPDVANNPGYSKGALYFVRSYFFAVQPLSEPFSEQVRSFRLNAKFLGKWLRQKPQKIGDFEIHNSFGGYWDAPLTLEVKTPEGQTIATIGGYLYYNGKKPEVRVNNFQGTTTAWSGVSKEKLLELYEKLNKQLGENWRVFFAKRAAAASKIKNLNIVGEFPQRFAHTADSEYKRQIRQYKQTYHKSKIPLVGARKVA